MSVIQAATVFEPADVQGVASALRRAASDRLPVFPAGGASLRHVPAERTGIAILSLRHLTTPFEHCAGDLTATIPAGARLSDVNAVLRLGGQWLPLDPPASAPGSIGGIVASNASGPRRHRYGNPRDLIIGIEMVLADGRIVKAGGRVVKNVAGYDLARLLCGSFGSLAVITAATFKLSPVASVSRTAVIDLAEPSAVGPLVRAIAAAPVTPSALELDAPPNRVLVRFETTPVAAEQQAGLVCEIGASHGGVVTVLDGQDEADAWQHYEERTWAPGGTIVKLSALPTRAHQVFEKLPELIAKHGIECRAGGRVALGVLYFRVPGRTSGHAAVVRELRDMAVALGGSLVVEQSERGVLAGVDRWGDLGDARAVHQAVKQRFDPGGLLSPGWGPGGV
jgi:glycolate oxidase FAD binding subunit